MSQTRRGKSPARSGKKTSFYVGGTYSLILSIPDLSEHHTAQLTLSAEDESYRQTIHVAEECVEVGNNRYRFTFTGVIPGRLYTLKYHADAEQENEDFQHDIFVRAFIDTDRMNRLSASDDPLREDY